MRLILKCFLLFVVTCFCTAQETEPMGDTDSTNNQDGSLNTNTVGSTVSSNNNSKDESVSNTYNGAGSSSSMPVGSAIAPSLICLMAWKRAYKEVRAQYPNRVDRLYRWLL